MHTLNELQIGDVGVIESITDKCSIKIRLTELGFTKGRRVAKIMDNVRKTLSVYDIMGCRIAIRALDASEILVSQN